MIFRPWTFVGCDARYRLDTAKLCSLALGLREALDTSWCHCNGAICSDCDSRPLPREKSFVHTCVCPSRASYVCPSRASCVCPSKASLPEQGKLLNRCCLCKAHAMCGVARDKVLHQRERRLDTRACVQDDPKQCFSM